MARITVEDCLEKVANRFDLVLVAAKRARQLAMGAANASVGTENDKVTVVALREVAAGNVDHGILRSQPKPSMDDVMVPDVQASQEPAAPSSQPMLPEEDQGQV